MECLGEFSDSLSTLHTLQTRDMKVPRGFQRFTAGIHRSLCLSTKSYHCDFLIRGSISGLFPPTYKPSKHHSLSRLISSACAQRSCTDLFHYTSGRWLWDEEQQLRDRFSPFNVPELQRVAASSVGANKCIEITKLAEGSFNKTFKLTLDNGMNVIARIPHPIAGPRHYTTASEVATMEFVRIISSF